MRILIMSGIMFMLAAVNGQASTIVLKDGRTITGDIVQQDNAKIVVQDGDSSLTYYKDEITSIDGESLTGEKLDPQKEALIQQYLAIFPASEIVSTWVNGHVPVGQWQAVLSSLNDDENISAMTRLMEQGLRKAYSKNDLKAAVAFYSSPEGKQISKDNEQFRKDIMPKLFQMLSQEAGKVIGSANVKILPAFK